MIKNKPSVLKKVNINIISKTKHPEIHNKLRMYVKELKAIVKFN